MFIPLPSTLSASDSPTRAWVGTSATFLGDFLGSCVNSEMYLQDPRWEHQTFYWNW